MENKTKPTLFAKILYKVNASQHYQKKSFSQGGEDLLIRNCLANFKIINPSYIDVGANHPYHFNNTALFYKTGCKGINIEPNSMLLNLFKKYRKNDTNLNIGIGAVAGELDYYEFESHTLNTCSEPDALNYEKLGFPILAVRKIKVYSLNEIIQNHHGGVFPDILSLDVEGLDEQILKSINYTTNYPKVICVETVKFDTELNLNNKQESILNYLKSCGYQVYADTFINTILFKR